MGADIRCAIVSADELPPDDDWLGPRERAVLAGLRFSARRESWRLGRHAARRLLGADVEVLPSPAGPPCVWRGAMQLPVSLSISHRDEVALCAVADGTVALGCDVERVEPRSVAFLEDFLTPLERAAVTEASDPEAQANLIWSAKESALKALHTGLRRDTWELEVTVGAAGELVVDDLPNQRRMRGAWWRDGGRVFTVVVA